MRPITIAESFDDHWVLDPDTGCWLWQRAKTVGYGRFSLNGKLKSAHHYTYERKNGPIQAGLFVLHKCDTPACCNPDHLFLGTQVDNLKDMRSKRRHNVGEKNGGAKLTRKQIEEIKRRYAAGGVTYYVLGREFGVAYQTVHKIVRGIRWVA